MARVKKSSRKVKRSKRIQHSRKKRGGGSSSSSLPSWGSVNPSEFLKSPDIPPAIERCDDLMMLDIQINNKRLNDFIEKGIINNPVGYKPIIEILREEIIKLRGKLEVAYLHKMIDTARINKLEAM